MGEKKEEVFIFSGLVKKKKKKAISGKMYPEHYFYKVKNNLFAI